VPPRSQGTGKGKVATSSRIRPVLGGSTNGGPLHPNSCARPLDHGLRDGQLHPLIPVVVVPAYARGCRSHCPGARGGAVSSPRRRRPSIPPCSGSERNVHEAFRTGSPIRSRASQDRCGSCISTSLGSRSGSLLGSSTTSTGCSRSWILQRRSTSYAGARARVGRSACGFKVRDDLLNLPLLPKRELSIGWVWGSL